MNDTNEGRDFIGEVIAEDAAMRCAVIGVKNVNSAMSAIDELRQQLADVSHERDLLRAAAAGKWREGAPQNPWDSEWFLADIGGSYAVLRPLPEEYTYDFTTADETYFMRHRVKRWAQLSDSEFVQPTEVKS